MTKLAVGMSREDSESYRAATIALENESRFGPKRDGPPDFG